MTFDCLTAPMAGADHRDIGGVQIDQARAGDCRVKRVIYPPWIPLVEGHEATRRHGPMPARIRRLSRTRPDPYSIR